MTESKHTPPPWTITPPDATWGWWWVHTADCDLTISGDRAEANANLIAAAPELLMQLEYAHHALAGLGVRQNDEMMLDIRAAIAKARSE